MSGLELLMPDRGKVHGVTFHEHVSSYIRGSHDFMGGIRRGLADCREGRIKPWSKIKKELGIG